MTTFADIARLAGSALIAAPLALSSVVAAQSQEDSARRRFESGRAFVASGNYGEAIKDFQVVLQTYPATSVADDALLEIATYQLEVARDVRAADASADTLLKQYPESDSAAMALVLKGRASLATGRNAEQVNAAIASFDRVPRLYEGTDAVPAAMFYAGEAARIDGRREEAIDRFVRLATQYPRSPFTSRALLGSASALVADGQPMRAMEQLQRIRQEFASSRDAATAREWNTILYRLYVRTPGQPAYLFRPDGPATKFRDVRDLAMDAANVLHVTTKNGIDTLAVDGKPGPFVSVQNARAMFFDGQGRALTIHDQGALREQGRPGIVLATAGDDGRMKPLRLEAGVATSSGDLLVADREMKALLRFSPEGKLLGEFARQIEARRLAISEMDEVAALETNTRAVALFDRDGQVLARIPDRGTGYQFRQPVDVAFDRLGHVYVLDRAAVFVFAQQGSKLLTTFSMAERTPGAFSSAEALALDSAARLYILDGRSDQVQVYR